MQKIRLLAFVGFTLFGISSPAPAASLSESIAVIRAVGPEGKGNTEATVAWKNLSSAPAKELPALLAAMDGANELALNWLRSAVDAVVARAAANKEVLPVATLEKFLG